jgi:hypothetical protein
MHVLPVRFALRALIIVSFFNLAIEHRASADIVDPSGDFLVSYAGTQGGDLDVISADVKFDTVTNMFTFSGTLHDTIGTTTGVSYIFGLNRGQGLARFASVGLTNVLFDSVVVLTTTGGNVRDLVSNATTLTLGTSDITIDGKTISASIPASAVVSRGFLERNYTWNLWTRLGSGNNNQLADFAPDNSNVLVRSVPEPTSMALLGIGAIAFAARRLKLRRRSMR